MWDKEEKTMSQKLLDTIICLDGVHSAMFLSANNETMLTAGDDNWHEILKETINLARLGGTLTEGKDADTIRIVFRGKSRSISVRKIGDHVFAVVMKTGHPIVKSAQRLIKRRIEKLAETYSSAANEVPDVVA
jgi:hypothetical protein